jgi:hypothetical protein
MAVEANKFAFQEHILARGVVSRTKMRPIPREMSGAFWNLGSLE